MPRHALPIALTESEEAVLDSLIRSPQSPQGFVVRLKIVRLAHEGCSNQSPRDMAKNHLQDTSGDTTLTTSATEQQ